MRTSIYILSLTLLIVRQAPLHGQADEGSAVCREYKVKAAFLLNFIKFIDGDRLNPPDAKDQAHADPNRPIYIGILGKLPPAEGFAQLAGKEVKNRPIVIRKFKGFDELKDADGKTPERHPDVEAIRKCHVLFVCPSEKPFLPGLLWSLRKDSILTVGDTQGFLESGTAINFLIEDNKVRFEINLAAARRAKLQIHSSLLRLALRTIEHDQLEKRNDP
jgi:hypothetical protein